jgi:hypothetical protein
MSQVDNFQVPAHPSGLEMRTQLNQIVLALVSANNGPVPPVQTYPLMWWGDTTANRLRIRNMANDAWTDLGPINDFLADIRSLVETTAAQKVNRGGDYMTGPLSMRSANVMFQNPQQNWFGYLGAYGPAGQGGSGIGIVDSTLTMWNFQVNNDGSVNVRGWGTITGGLRVQGGRLELRQLGGPGHGEIAMYSVDGTVMFMRGRAQGGGMEWINNDYNNIPMALDNAGNLTCAAEVWANGGNGRLAGNGNIWGSVWGGWLSDWVNASLGGKASAGAQVQHGSGIGIEIAALNIGGGSDSGDLPAPWVCAGLRRDTNNWIYVRGLWLRNQ